MLFIKSCIKNCSEFSKQIIILASTGNQLHCQTKDYSRHPVSFVLADSRDEATGQYV